MESSVVEFGKYYRDCISKQEALKRLLLLILRWRFETWSNQQLLTWWRRTAHPDIQDTQVLFFGQMPVKSELVEMCLRTSLQQMGRFQFHELSDLIDAPLLAEVRALANHIEYEVKPANSSTSRLWKELGLN